jgi:RNA polymerase sigma factor (sigma-70 family)
MPRKNTSRIDPADKGKIIELARERVSSGETSLGVICRMISEVMRITPDAIRALLIEYNATANGSSILFQQRFKPGKFNELAEDHLAGTSLDDICARYPHMDRAILIGEIRSAVLSIKTTTRFRYQYHQDLDVEMTDDEIDRKGFLPLLDFTQPLTHRTPLLSEDEARLFYMMNWHINQAATSAQSNNDNGRDKHVKKYESIRNHIWEANRGLIVKFCEDQPHFLHEGDSMMSDANEILLNCLESFDYRKNKFSTYLTSALVKSFSNFRRRGCGYTGLKRENDFDLESVQGASIDLDQELDTLAAIPRLREAMESLDERSRTILELRFGIGTRDEPKTLKEIGRGMDRTKECIRQIEAKALAKLSASLNPNAAESIVSRRGHNTVPGRGRLKEKTA